MIAAACLIGGCVIAAVGFWLKDLVAARVRMKTDRIAQQILAAQAKQDAAIDHDKTPKPRTEQEIRDALKARTHHILR